MLCLSIGACSEQEAIRTLRSDCRFADLVELRLDLLPAGAVEQLVQASSLPVIATCRRKHEGGAFAGSASQEIALLQRAVAAGARYVDIDVRSADALARPRRRRKDVRAPLATLRPAKLIISYHDFRRVPRDLRAILRRIAGHYPDYAKIAVTPRDARDAIRFLKTARRYCAASVLADTAGTAASRNTGRGPRQKTCRQDVPSKRDPACGGTCATGSTDLRSVFVAMGENGVFERILYRRFGSAWTYAASCGMGILPMILHGRDARATGQLDIAAMRNSYRARKCTMKTRVFAIIGDPLTHSRSPAHFNALFKKHRLDAVFVPLRLANIREFPKLAEFLDLRGASITMPHKESIRRYLRDLSPEAQVVGAVNTIVRGTKGYVGYNTDTLAAAALLLGAAARLRHLPSHRSSTALSCGMGILPMILHGRDARATSGLRALVLGAGGVARAVVYALVRAGATVLVANRTFERAAKLAAKFGCIPLPWEARADTTVDILVNATSCGMGILPMILHGRDARATSVGMAGGSSGSADSGSGDSRDSPFPLDRLQAPMLVMDCVHTPEYTPLLQTALKKKCIVISGVQLFTSQAALQWNLFRQAL